MHITCVFGCCLTKAACKIVDKIDCGRKMSVGLCTARVSLVAACPRLQAKLVIRSTVSVR